MIELDRYLVFVGASLLLVLAPGPDMAYLLGRSVAQGRRAGAIGAVGINAGAYVHLIAATLGLSALLMTSSLAFSVVKWTGACYLVWIGVQAVRGAGSALAGAGPLPVQSDRTIFWQGFLNDVLNPKVALFYLAFLPQFVDPAGGSATTQLVLLGATLNVLALIGNLAIVHFFSIVTDRLRQNERVTAWLQRGMGALLVALGLRLACDEA